MKQLKKTALVLLVAATFLFAGMSDLFARRGGGSRSFSRPSSSSRSRSVSRPSTSKSTSRSTSSKSTKPTTSKRTTSAPKRTPAQTKSFEAAKKNGTASMTKSQSVSKFKSDKAMQTKYTSKYSTKPATRPAHIPQSTMVNGQSVNINYNAGMGGYGYTNALGAWIMYDMMSDAIMRDRMMTQSGYLHSSHPAVVGTVVPYRGPSAGAIIVTLIIVVGAICVIGVVIKNRQGSS